MEGRGAVQEGNPGGLDGMHHSHETGHHHHTHGLEHGPGQPAPGSSSAPGPGGMMMMGHSGHYFQLRTTNTLLSPGWSLGTVYGLVPAMLAAVIAGIGFELLHGYQNHYTARATEKHKQHRSQTGNAISFSRREKLVLSCLTMSRMLLGYFMMLCVMTMNVWLAVAVILGTTLGYGLFRPLMTSSLESPSDRDQSSFKRGEMSARSESWRFKGFTVDQSMRLSAEEELALIKAKRRSPRPQLNMRFSKDKLYIEQPQQDEVLSENGNSSRNNSASGTVDSGSVVENPEDTDVVTRRAGRSSLSSVSSDSAPGSARRFKSTSKVINMSFRDDTTGLRRTPESDAITTTPRRSSRFHSTSKVIADEFKP